MIERKIYCFGEILWDNFPAGKLPGGAPLNVAYHAKNLGLDSYLYSSIGNDKDGNELKRFLTDLGINVDYVNTIECYPTGNVTVNLKNPKEVTYTIDSPSAWDFIGLDKNLFQRININDIVVFGTLSARSIESRSTLNSLLESPAYTVMDLNLRPPYYSKRLVANLLSKTNLLKVNKEEYAQLADWFNLSSDPKDGFEGLLNLFNINELVITSGSQGSRLISKSVDVTSKTFDIDCADTVGAGDSFLAALIFGITHKFEHQKMVDFASGLGALVASKTGATPKFTRKDLEEFINPLSTSYSS